MPEGKFVTAINCMDGRVQEPIIQFFKSGTVPISIKKHGSNLIAVVKSWGFDAKVIGLYVVDNYNVEVVRN